MDQKQFHVLSYERVVKRIVEEEWEKTKKKTNNSNKRGVEREGGRKREKN